jgi:transposase
MRNIQRHVAKNQDVFIGLEDSKKTWVLCARSNGVIIHETSMPAEYDVLRNYLRNKFPECKISVLYEAGFRGFGLYDCLKMDGFTCVVTPPHTVTKEMCQRLKNDRIDCRRLSKNLENGDYRSCYVPERSIREDRQISRVYEHVKRDITRVSNRIRRALEFHGIDHDFRPGRWGMKDYRGLKQYFETRELSSSLRFSMSILIEELERLREKKKKVVKELNVLSQSERYKNNVKLLMSVPGVGTLTAIRFLLELGDIRRFRRKEELSSFLGLIPGEYSSGEKEHKGHITKQGCRWLRAWLVECGWSAIRKDPVMLEKFNRVSLHSGSRKKAIVAVARKLAIRMRAVLLSGEPYIIGMVS